MADARSCGGKEDDARMAATDRARTANDDQWREGGFDVIVFTARLAQISRRTFRTGCGLPDSRGGVGRSTASAWWAANRHNTPTGHSSSHYYYYSYDYYSYDDYNYAYDDFGSPMRI